MTEVRRKLKPAELQGKYFPWDPVAREPRFLKLARNDLGGSAFFMLFSDEGKLHELMTFLKVRGYTVETLQAVDFLDSLPSVHAGLPVRTVVDPHVAPGSKKLWLTLTVD